MTATLVRTEAPTTTRDGFLDVVRSIAVVRVVAWHTWGAAALSWLVAAMPAMFFVTGSLLAASLDRRAAREVVADRLRRLLIPFWAFAVVAHLAMGLAWWLRPAADTRIPWWQPLAWVLPIVDPVGTPWEATWLSRPLWYLRVVVWLLLAAPALRWAYRRFGLALCAVPAVLTIAAELWFVDGSHPAVRFHLTDAVTYGTFVLLGFWHQQGGTRAVPTWARWVECGAGALAAATWMAWRGPDSWVVNDSPVLLLFVGWAWLWAFLALEPTLARFGTSGPVRWLSRRSLTVYLWHTTAIVGTYALLDHLPFRGVPVTAALVVAGTAIAVVLLGWLEDVAAGRPARLPGRRTAGLALAVAVVWAVAATQPATEDASAFVPPPPSARPPELVFDAASIDSPAPTTTTVPPVSSTTTTQPPTMEERVASALGDFAARWGDAAIAGIAFTADRSSVWSGSIGTGFEEERVLAASVTKSVTATIVNQLVDEGRFALDVPITAIEGVPSWPGGAGITIRHLLEHSSGIVSYSDAPGYDAKVRYTPQAALELALRAPRTNGPGGKAGYSNSGYLALGLLIEQETGRAFRDVAHDRVFKRLGMASAKIHDEAEPGFIGHASGGLQATLPDLGRFVRAVYREGTLVSGQAFKRMLPSKTSVGLGVSGFCPCATDGTILAVGHDGGTISARLFRDVDTIVVLRFSGGIYDSEERRDAVYALDHVVARIVAGRL